MSGPAPPSPAKHLLRELDDVAREYYRRLAEHGRPATTRCEGCGVTSFPPRERCARCGEPQAWVELPLEGRLHAYTTQETALRFRAPAVLALVELGDAVVPAIGEGGYDELRIGQEVELEAIHEPETSLTVLSFRPRAS